MTPVEGCPTVFQTICSLPPGFHQWWAFTGFQGKLNWDYHCNIYSNGVCNPFIIVPQLIQFGKVFRAGLNIEIAPDLIANQLNVRNGALILQVPGNSLAAKAGLRPTTRGFAGNIVLGDIILAVDDKPMLLLCHREEVSYELGTFLIDRWCGSCHSLVQTP